MTDTDLLPCLDDALNWWRNCPNEPWNSKYAREIDKLVLVGLASTPSSTRANGRGDEQCALELLALMYDKYENGVCVYEDTGDPDDVGNHMGNSFMLDADDESEIVDLLNRRVPRDVDANSKS